MESIELLYYSLTSSGYGGKESFYFLSCILIWNGSLVAAD